MHGKAHPAHVENHAAGFGDKNLTFQMRYHTSCELGVAS
jgi:hypothetical protein